MYLLQIGMQTLEKQTSLLSDYGMLGLFALFMIAVIAYLEKQRLANDKSTRDNVDRLEKSIETQRANYETQRTAFENKLAAQQKAFDEFIRGEYKLGMEVNNRCLEVLEEVRVLLRESYKH